MALLTCDNLSVGYEGRPVAKDIQFAVHPGDYLCIVGENGSGKTTLMKTIQQSAAQRDFPASVKEVVLSGCLNQGRGLFYTKAQKERARHNMERLDVWKLQNRCYRELSGGQQQRALLARALCAADTMLLLDEPAAGLDPQITEDMYQVIKQLNQAGLTIIMITHDVAASLTYASHILHVAGTPLYFGPKAGYLQSPEGRRYAQEGKA